jgi:uncharacterized cupredoxin-like copper-binding protein
MKNRRAFALGGAAIAVALVATACGDDDGTTSAGSSGDGRVIEITMTDMAYSPSTIDVAAGETVTFRFTNDGEAVHEALIGDEAAQMDHEQSMTSSTMEGDDGMDMDHGTDSDEVLTVEPGEMAEMSYTFAGAGMMLMGCHQPGHYAAGMKATINIS